MPQRHRRLTLTHHRLRHFALGSAQHHIAFAKLREIGDGVTHLPFRYRKKLLHHLLGTEIMESRHQKCAAVGARRFTAVIYSAGALQGLNAIGYKNVDACNHTVPLLGKTAHGFHAKRKSGGSDGKGFSAGEVVAIVAHRGAIFGSERYAATHHHRRTHPKITAIGETHAIACHKWEHASASLLSISLYRRDSL